MTTRVLVVAFSFPPQGGTGTVRIAKFVKYLPEFGWQPVVVCSDLAWNPDPSLAADIPADIEVHRVPWPQPVRPFAPKPPARSADRTDGGTASGPARTARARGLALAVVRKLLVPDVGVLWMRGAQRVCGSVLRETPCDAVLTTSPPNSIHLAGEWVKAHFGLPWVADFRDVWTAENLALQAAGRLHFARQRRTEARMLAACDRAVMANDLIRRTAEVFGADLGRKMVKITNGYDPDDFGTPQPVRDPGVFTIAYAGTVLGPQVANDFPDGLRLALSQSESFKGMARIRFIGQLDAGFRARLEGLETNVEMQPFVPHAEAVDAMRSADLLLLLLPDTVLAGLTYTNKFFEYLAAGRPILALAPPGVISGTLAESRAGVAVSPNDPAAIARALLEMFDAWRSRPGSYTPEPALMARFARRNLTRELANVLNEAVEEKHGA